MCYIASRSHLHSALKYTRLWKCRQVSTRADAESNSFPQNLAFFPDFFTIPEQRILVKAALQKLDSIESKLFRRRRKMYVSGHPPPDDTAPIQDLFLPDAYYQFEEGHYDGVIRNFREMHISSWPEDENPKLTPILERLRSLHPPTSTQTHVLHLASNGGHILPHIDNVSASGAWILGVSLGAERIMRLESLDSEDDCFDILLPSGSVYIQKDDVRFRYNHAILEKGMFCGKHIEGGQRLSIMIRDHLQRAKSHYGDKDSR